MATEQQVDDVIVAVVDHGVLMPHPAFLLGLNLEAIEEAIDLGYIEKRGEDLYPTDEGIEYRALITTDEEE